LVRLKLDAILSGNVPAPRMLEEFLKDHRRMAITAFVQWFEANNPSNDQLRRMFPGHKTVESIRNKLSQWKREIR